MWLRVCSQSEFFIDNLLVRVHFTILMTRWTGLAPWEFVFPFPGSFTSTFLSQIKEGNPTFFEAQDNQEISGLDTYNIKKNPRYRSSSSLLSLQVLEGP